MHVGFIGSGIMGAPMALNILKRGNRLSVYNRTPGKDRALVEARAIAVAAPQDIGGIAAGLDRQRHAWHRSLALRRIFPIRKEHD